MMKNIVFLVVNSFNKNYVQYFHDELIFKNIFNGYKNLLFIK